MGGMGLIFIPVLVTRLLGHLGLSGPMTSNSWTIMIKLLNRKTASVERLIFSSAQYNKCSKQIYTVQQYYKYNTSIQYNNKNTDYKNKSIHDLTITNNTPNSPIQLPNYTHHPPTYPLIRTCIL